MSAWIKSKSSTHQPNLELYAIPLLGEQATGGSTSTRDQWAVLREAGAVARTMLVTAAANRWRVDPASCTVERGVVVHAASGRKLAFGALAKAAGALPIPPKVALKDPATFTLIGKPLRRIDSPDKVVGATQFGIDAKVPGMKIATVKACPTRGGKLVSVDDARARAVPGFVEVVKIGNAVAVVGDHFWAAKQGLDALGIQWDLGENAQLTTAMLTEALAERSRNGATIIGRQQGKKPDEGKTVEALYQLPLLAHAPMEPLNTTVHVTSDRCEIWVGTQVPVRCVTRRGQDYRVAREQGHCPQPLYRRRVWPQVGDRFGRAGRPVCEAGQVPAQGDLDARGRHPPRSGEADVLRPNLRPAREGRPTVMVQRSHHERHGPRPLAARRDE